MMLGTVTHAISAAPVLIAVLDSRTTETCIQAMFLRGECASISRAGRVAEHLAADALTPQHWARSSVGTPETYDSCAALLVEARAQQAHAVLYHDGTQWQVTVRLFARWTPWQDLSSVLRAMPVLDW